MDPLITELITASKTAESDVLPSIVEALAAVARSAGKNVGPVVKEMLMELIDESFDAKTSGMPTRRRNVAIKADHLSVDAYSAAVGKLIAGLSLWDPESVRDILT